MTEIPEDERAVRLDEALARSQREERDERNADLERQRHADEQIVNALAKRPAADD